MKKKAAADGNIVLKQLIDRYRALTAKTAAVPGLAACVQKLVDERDGPSYVVETPVVFNGALDEEGALDDIRMILVGDNPGRREQENKRYLVGPSGKIAEKFFRDHPELGIDFRKNVIILNKTPIHTARTIELKELCRMEKACAGAVCDSQEFMAELLAALRTALGAGHGNSLSIWIIGYSEMKKGGIFEAYTEKLKALCSADPSFKESIFFFRHFSMNQFTADLKQQALPGETVSQSLERIGTAYRKRVLG